MFSLLVFNMKFNAINGPIEPYLRSIIVSLLSIKSSIRIQTKINVLKTTSSPGGTKLASLLLNEITLFLEYKVNNNYLIIYFNV